MDPAVDSVLPKSTLTTLIRVLLLQEDGFRFGLATYGIGVIFPDEAQSTKSIQILSREGGSAEIS